MQCVKVSLAFVLLDILLVDVGCIAGPDHVVLGQLDHLVYGQVA